MPEVKIIDNSVVVHELELAIKRDLYGLLRSFGNTYNVRTSELRCTSFPDADPGEISQNVAFYLGIRRLLKSLLGFSNIQMFKTYFGACSVSHKLVSLADALEVIL